jgi:hypothetical protein
VRRGQLIDTTDDSEGIRDRPPTSESTPPAGNALPLEQNPLLNGAPQQPPTGGAALPPSAHLPPLMPVSLESTGGELAPTSNRSLECACVGVAAAAAAGWSQRVDQALENGDADAWRRLRRAGRIGRFRRLLRK